VAILAAVWGNVETRDWLHSAGKLDRDWIIRVAAVQELARGWKDDTETPPMLKERALSDEDHNVRSAGLHELARGWKDDPDLPAIRAQFG